MSTTANKNRGGEFATTRRGAISAYEHAFITQKRAAGVPDSAIAKMIGRPVTEVAVTGLRAVEAKPAPAPAPEPSPESEAVKVLRSVARRHGLSVPEMIAGPSTQRFVLARDEAMWRLRQLKRASGKPRFSFVQIAKLTGRQDHTSAIDAIRRQERRIQEGEA